jgi:hypothetical protein
VTPAPTHPFPPMRNTPSPRPHLTQFIQRATAMQGTSQLIRSNQKRLEDVWRIREANANGTSILTDQEVGQIKEQAALLGEYGGAMVGRILDQAKELAGQPADVLKMVDGHLKELSKRVALRELSAELEKERAPKRTARLKVMEAEVDKLWVRAQEGRHDWYRQGVQQPERPVG